MNEIEKWLIENVKYWNFNRTDYSELSLNIIKKLFKFEHDGIIADCGISVTGTSIKYKFKQTHDFIIGPKIASLLNSPDKCEELVIEGDIMTSFRYLPIHINKTITCYSHIVPYELRYIFSSYIRHYVVLYNSDIQNFINSNLNPNPEDIPRLIKELKKFDIN